MELSPLERFVSCPCSMRKVSHEENIDGARCRLHLGHFGRGGTRASARPTRFWPRSRGRLDRRRHRRRRACRSWLLRSRLWLLRTTLWLLRRPGLCRWRLLRRLRLATAALLGWVWLADSPCQGVRLIPFTFITKRPVVPQTTGRPEKTFFSGH